MIEHSDNKRMVFLQCEFLYALQDYCALKTILHSTCMKIYFLCCEYFGVSQDVWIDGKILNIEYKQTDFPHYGYGFVGVSRAFPFVRKILDICHKKKFWLQCEHFDELIDDSYLKMTSSIVYKKKTCLWCLQRVVFHFPHHNFVEVTYLDVYLPNPCSKKEFLAI